MVNGYQETPMERKTIKGKQLEEISASEKGC